jgi:hypothetical protein
MTRGGRSTWGIMAHACVLAALVIVAAPATAGAQSGVDEYTLDIPGGGSSSGGAGDPPAAGAAGSGSGSEGAGSGGQGSGSGGGGGSDAKRDASKRSLDELDELHSGASGGKAPLSTDSRSAPEVVADTLFDGTMLPLLAALVAITGVGAWRLVRHRRTLTGTAG